MNLLVNATGFSSENEPDIDELSFIELREKLLALDPLNRDML